MREILKELDDKITTEDLDMMIQEIDSDGSGTVDFNGKLDNNLISPKMYLNHEIKILREFKINKEYLQIIRIYPIKQT